MAEERVFASFQCQRCLSPLLLDNSFNSIGEHTLAELSLPINSTPDDDIESQATSYDNYIHPCGLSDSGTGANGFMLIQADNDIEPQGKQLEVMPWKQVNASLFDVITGNSNIDHPLCSECTDTLLELLEQELQLAEIDYRDYLEYLKKLEQDTSEPQLADLQNQFQELEAEEQKLKKELEELKEEKLATLQAIKEQEEKGQRLSMEEERYYKEYTRYRVDYMNYEDEYKSLDTQLKYTEKQLDKLNKTNVFNATFHIWHSGHFGTINNFRLGRLPTSQVEWSEINAAWGQTALLLSALARKINLTFDKYRLVPYGNHSYIEVINEKKELPLYGMGGVRFLWDPKFDSGMAAFLDCLRQFQDKVTSEKGDKDFSLPYRMKNGKIEDKQTTYSIKIQLNSEEQWTKALKFMLTNLKWCLAWVSSQFNKDETVTN